jgi:hypothetical protein
MFAGSVDGKQENFPVRRGEACPIASVYFLNGASRFLGSFFELDGARSLSAGKKRQSAAYFAAWHGIGLE